MSNNTMIVSYDTSNAKSVKHPSNGDIWDEAIACIDILQSGAPVTAVNIMLNEIRWFEKYREQNINVADSFLDMSLNVDDYIAELESNLFMHDIVFNR
tara:strand:- start:312 stop:605 length:294 start_codon:yes stop_codon:yes gene_type:complete